MVCYAILETLLILTLALEHHEILQLEYCQAFTPTLRNFAPVILPFTVE
jgi:hypothetical protein